MTEITKLYKNAGITKVGIKKCTTTEYLDCQDYCFISENNKCDKFSYQYPLFTAEKQIEILKLIFKKSRIFDVGYNVEQGKYSCMHYEGTFDSLEEALCADINYHWQDLTEEEKQQVKGILK